MMRAVIFDCDGVLADSEPAHLEAFRETLAREGIPLTAEEYFGRYLAFDDRDFFRLVYADRERALDEALLRRLLEEKGRRLAARLAGIPLFEGSFAFARRAMEGGLEVAVASGARRREVETVIRRGGLPRPPAAVVCAGEVPRGKPHADPFLGALRLLNRGRGGREILPRECLVVEDSIVGVRAGRAAGMWVVALTTSYGEADLAEAHLVLDDLGGWTVAEVEGRLGAREEAR